MPALADKKFREWTNGLDARDSIISVFRHIRNIPYSLTATGSHDMKPAEWILVAGRGSCSPKHYLLADMFRQLGFEVVFATFPFLWNDPDLRYPQILRNLATSLPVAYHLACRVRIDNRWVLVDATWDPPLSRGGFPINEDWDGRSDTRCAVKPLKSAIRTAFCRTATNEPCRNNQDSEYNPLDGEQDHRDADDRARYYHGRTTIRTPDEIERIKNFYQQFDAWLAEIRKNP